MSKGYQDLYEKLPCEFTIDDIIMLKSHCNSLIKENQAHKEHIDYLYGKIKLLEISIEAFENDEKEEQENE